MAKYYASLRITPPPDFTDEQLNKLLREAIGVAKCVALTVASTGLCVDADYESLSLLESTLRDMLERVGATLRLMMIARA